MGGEFSITVTEIEWFAGHRGAGLGREGSADDTRHGVGVVGHSIGPGLPAAHCDPSGFVVVLAMDLYR